MIHTKPIVVLGSEYNGTHAGFFGQGYNAVRIPVYRIELSRCIAIPVAENSRKRLNLLAVSAGNRFAVIHAAVL